MVKYILSAWGWSMPQSKHGTVKYEDLTEDEFKEEIQGAIPYIGNPEIARILKLPYSPGYITLEKGDVAYVIQVKGGKIPHGATELPLGCDWKFTKAELVEVTV